MVVQEFQMMILCIKRRNVIKVTFFKLNLGYYNEQLVIRVVVILLRANDCLIPANIIELLATKESFLNSFLGTYESEETPIENSSDSYDHAHANKPVPMDQNTGLCSCGIW